MQIGSADCRHGAKTLCQLSRHGDIPCPLNVLVYEEEPEGLARHVMLLSILLDETLPQRDRMERFLEVHGNCLLQEKTAAHLGMLQIYIVTMVGLR